jgi:hypothetical protein
MKNSMLPISLAGLLLAAVPAATQAQAIVFSGGTADLTFYFDSANTTQPWDVVLRSKASTEATGLTTPLTRPREGAPSVASGEVDWQFSSLLVQLSEAPFIEGFWVSRRGTTAYNDPDLGFRTRLRENVEGTVVDQFDTFTLSLNLGNSVMPAGAEFAMFNYPAIDGLPGPASFLLNTATNLTENSSYPVWGHSHYHWGFSQQGDYTIALDFWGTKNGVMSAVGSTSIDFQVIPEPSTVAAILGAGVLGFALFLRRRRRA